MQCELCGKNESRLVKTRIEGAELSVCENCTSMGERLEQAPRPGRFPGHPSFARKPLAPKEPSFAPDAGQRIQHAREARTWSREELGAKVFEKSSVIERLERNDLPLSDAQARKLEKILAIKLFQ